MRAKLIHPHVGFAVVVHKLTTNAESGFDAGFAGSVRAAIAGLGHAFEAVTHTPGPDGAFVENIGFSFHDTP